MLRINVITSAAAAQAYYSKADYYGVEMVGNWGGKAAAMLELRGPVDHKAFGNLCEGLDPRTGWKITPGAKENRRPGYDFTFSVPKSISLLYELTGDARLLTAFRDAVRETMAALEREAKTRVRKNGQDTDRLTGNLAWAEFVHGTARPVDGLPDPHLHAHVVVFNLTYDAVESHWKAGQFGELKADGPWWEASFDARLAEKLQTLGYAIAAQGKAWELAGVPGELVKAFSRRTTLIDKAAATLGIKRPETKAKLGGTTREAKNEGLTQEELRIIWGQRAGKENVTLLQGIAERAKSGPPESNPALASKALAWSVAHHTERASAVDRKELFTSALRYQVGGFTLDDLQHAYQQALASGTLLEREKDSRPVVIDRSVLEEEREIARIATESKGTCKPVNRTPDLSGLKLDQEQKEVVRHLLTGKDRVMLVRGKAGTGKTTTMNGLKAAVNASGKRIIPLAPTGVAGRIILRAEVQKDANTLSRFLMDEEMQLAAQGQVVVLDEAGMVGTKDMLALLRLSEKLVFRVVAVGDPRQHKSVARGDSFRLLEEHAGLVAAELSTIRRQRGEYRRAALGALRDSLQQGDILFSGPLAPDYAKFLLRQSFVLGFPGGSPELRLCLWPLDSQRRRRLVDERGATGERFDQLSRNAGQFPRLALGRDGIPQGLQLLRQPRVEGGFPPGAVGFQLAELPGFPVALDGVVGQIENDDVGVQVGIGQAVHGPRGAMHELRPGEVAGQPIRVLAVTHLVGDVARLLALGGFVRRVVVRHG